MQLSALEFRRNYSRMRVFREADSGTQYLFLNLSAPPDVAREFEVVNFFLYVATVTG